MKLLVLALFVAAATAAPLDDSNGPIELIVNGVPDGHALELGEIVDIKLQEHSDAGVVATNVLHPLTAVGIAEAAAAAAAETPIAVVMPEAPAPEITFPEAVVLPAPPQPDVIYPEAAGTFPLPAVPDVVVPAPVVLPSPAQPEVIYPEAADTFPLPAVPDVVVPGPVVLPSPAQPEVVIPEAVVLPAPAQPEVVPEVALPEPIPAPAAQLPTGEVYNDGTVQVTVNAPQDVGMISTIQGWFSMILNYINDGTVQSSQQIV